MNLQPWRHWSLDGKPGPHTPEIRKVLEAGLGRWPAYPSLCHLYIHTMEASPIPEQALACANNLLRVSCVPIPAAPVGVSLETIKKLLGCAAAKGL